MTAGTTMQAVKRNKRHREATSMNLHSESNYGGVASQNLNADKIPMVVPSDISQKSGG